MRKLIFVSLAAILANLLPFVTHQPDAGESFTYHAVKKAIPSIVEIESRGTSMTKGVGVIADPFGMIVTNMHTIMGSSSIKVTLHGKETAIARIIKLFPENDIAMIKIYPPCPLSPVTFANTNRTPKGTDIFTVGQSRFLNGVVISGKVTGVITRTDANTKKRLPGYFIKTRFDAKAYKGDSGSPVFDKDGLFLGIIFARSDENSYFSLMVPAEIIMQDYLAAKKVERN